METRRKKRQPVLKCKNPIAGAARKQALPTRGVGGDSGEFFRRVYMEGPLGIAVSSPDFRFVSANAAFCDMMGYSESKLISMSSRDITHPAHVGKDAAAIAKLHAGEMLVYKTEKRYIRSSGQIFWATVTLSALRSAQGRVKYFMALVEDISDRKQTDLALQESEELFRRIIEHAPMSMAIVSMDGAIEYINKKSIETFGYLHADIPNMERWWVQAYPNESYRKEVVANWMGLVERAVIEKHEIKGGEYRVTCKDGTVKSVYIFGVPVANRIFVMFEDVTERRKAEERVKNSAMELRSQKKALEVKNIAMREVLTQIEVEKLKIKKQIAANAEKLVLPLLNQLKRKAAPSDWRQFDLLELNIRDLTSKFGAQISSGASSLSAREREICNMVKNGMSSKEISQILNLSPRTVDTYRNRIRKKLGITSMNGNLFAHLQKLA